MSNRPIGYLHLLAQYCEHAEARVVGTRIGLEALAKAVQHALKYREAESAPVFVNDGEGYTVQVQCVEDGKVDELERPYASYWINEEATRWRERAFAAEAELSKLRKTPVLPSAAPMQMSDLDFSGLSPSQQALLTFCGWDRHCDRPRPRKSTVQPLIARGLVVLHPLRAGGSDPARYEVPITVHAAWCAYCADADGVLGAHNDQPRGGA